MENVAAFLGAALALMGSPGPATLSSAASGSAFGRRGALPYVFGITSGTMTVIAMIALGLLGLVSAVPGAGQVVAMLAAAYILYLAWRIATAPPLGQLNEQARAPRFVEGYVLAIANPKAYAAIGAVFSGFVLVEGDPTADHAVKFALLIALPAAINLGWMHMGAALARRLRDPRASRALNVTFAVALVVSVGVSLVL